MSDRVGLIALDDVVVNNFHRKELDGLPIITQWD